MNIRNYPALVAMLLTIFVSGGAQAQLSPEMRLEGKLDQALQLMRAQNERIANLEQTIVAIMAAQVAQSQAGTQGFQPQVQLVQTELLPAPIPNVELQSAPAPAPQPVEQVIEATTQVVTDTQANAAAAILTTTPKDVAVVETGDIPLPAEVNPGTQYFTGNYQNCQALAASMNRKASFPTRALPTNSIHANLLPNGMVRVSWYDPEKRLGCFDHYENGITVLDRKVDSNGWFYVEVNASAGNRFNVFGLNGDSVEYAYVSPEMKDNPLGAPGKDVGVDGCTMTDENYPGCAFSFSPTVLHATRREEGGNREIDQEKTSVPGA